MSTVAIVLAADAGDHFAGPKYLAPVHGVPMLQRVVDEATTWRVAQVYVVLGAAADAIIDVIDFKEATVIIDAEWQEGSASPLRAALDLASRDRAVRRCVVARGDQSSADAETVAALLEKAIETDADAVTPKYRYSVGLPVVLDASLWEHLLGGEGSVDLLDVVASHATTAEEVWFDHLGPVRYEEPDDLLGGR